jgi:hypothetical protein
MFTWKDWGKPWKISDNIASGVPGIGTTFFQNRKETSYLRGSMFVDTDAREHPLHVRLQKVWVSKSFRKLFRLRQPGPPKRWYPTTKIHRVITQKMKAARSTETLLVSYHNTTSHHNSDDLDLKLHRREIQKFCAYRTNSWICKL